MLSINQFIKMCDRKINLISTFLGIQKEGKKARIISPLSSGRSFENVP